MRKLFFRILPFLTLLSCCTVPKQTGQFKKVCHLPGKVLETSGITLKNKNEIWTINDSGGHAELYLCNTSGKLMQTVEIKNAKNHDWEDLTQDEKGNLYIADTGNNGNDRHNLRIYKLQADDLKKEKVKAEEIRYRYEDQTEFPPGADHLYFDCEAIIWYQHQLYLFTKSRCWPATCTVYRIPDTPGEYVARKIVSYTTKATATKQDLINSYWITAAAVSPDGSKLALLSNDRVWIFSDFPQDRFFEGKKKLYKLDQISQKESICFIDNNHLFITDEQGENKKEGRNLYRLTIDE